MVESRIRNGLRDIENTMAIDADKLKGNIGLLLKKIDLLEQFTGGREEFSDSDILKIDVTCAEITLLALSTSDDADDLPALDNGLLWGEIAMCLRQIAYHSLSIQDWQSGADEESFSSVLLSQHVKQITAHAAFIRKNLGIECKEKAPGSIIAVDVEEEKTDFGALVLSGLTEDQLEKLRSEIAALRELLAALVFERDDLLLSQRRKIEARYMQELGSTEAEIYSAECEVRYLRAQLRMMQAYVNRQEDIPHEKINRELKEEFKTYQQVYEEFVRKARKAAETAKQEAEAETETAEDPDSRERENSDSGKAQDDRKREESPKQQPKEAESKEARLKKLYRKTVKAMHPDAHPDQTEEEKALFRKAIDAYKAKDLKTLEEIVEIMEGTTREEEESALEALLKEKARLLTLVERIRKEIKKIKSQYPFNKLEILDDPEKLAARKEALQAKLERLRTEAELYREKIGGLQAKQESEKAGE